eukprot:scaffold6.g2890.t1
MLLSQVKASAAQVDEITAAVEEGSASPAAAAKPAARGGPPIPAVHVHHAHALHAQQQPQVPAMDMQAAMVAMSSGQHRLLLERVSARMGVTPQELQAAASAVVSGQQGAIPPAVLQRAMQLQAAAAAGGAGAPLAPPAGAEVSEEEALLPSAAALRGSWGHPPPPPPPRGAPQGADEDEQGWLELYSRAYLRRLDAFYPPLFVALAAAFFWAGMLPFWAALAALPLFFLLGIHCLLVKLAKIPPPLLPFSRLPFALIASLEVAAVAAFYLTLLPLVRLAAPRVAAFAVTSTAALALHYRWALLLGRCCWGARGANPAQCFTCNIYKPIRSKHCANCDRCVAEFDHCCPAVNNCVGAGNRRAFMGYLLSLWAAEALWLSLAGTFWRRALQTQLLHSEGLPSGWEVARHALALAAWAPGTAFLHCLVALILAGTSYLAGRQLLCVAGNLTTNELLMRSKYGYLHAPDHSFSNPFDEGPAANCLTFWSGGPRPDWYALYAERRGQRAAPAASVTSLLRRWEAASAALAAARAARLRRRQDRLLQEYGGVRPEALAAAEGGGAGGAGGCQHCRTHG